MTEYTVFFPSLGQSIRVSEGTTLLNAEIMAGLKPDAPCGGNGTCGKCKSLILENGSSREVLACHTKVTSDLYVELPRRGENRILTSGSGAAYEVASPIEVLSCKVRRCAPGENRADFDLLRDAVADARGIEAELIPASPAVASDLHDTLESCGYEPTVVCFGNEIIAVNTEASPICGIAFDIGTTSIVGYLLDLVSGATLATVSTINPQSQYGADVIMRANYALSEGVAALRDTVRAALRELTAQAISIAGISRSDIYLVVAVGNTCMHHLLLGISPSSLVHAPYNPALSDPLTLPAADFGMPTHANAKMLVLPNIAGFVGADTVGVLLSTRFEKIEPVTLAIDIGTNGELVLGNKSRRIACSTAAGPAFEGAKIACGMRGATGAIDHVTLEGDKITFTTIEGGKPAGICGSGLMDLVAVLLDAGIIDDSGRLLPADEQDSPAGIANADRLIEVDGQNAFLLASKEESATGEIIYLGQKDIREVQLAKGAMAAGIGLLAKALGLKVTDIEEVLIAGAFGNYMSPHSACRIGLIPPELESKIRPIGNAAGEGAKMAALNREAFHRAGTLARSTAFLELASDPEFQDCFVDELLFPEE